MIRELAEDDHGAAYSVDLFPTTYVRDLLPGLKDGVYGCSFRFRVGREEVEMAPRRSEWNPEGIEERTIVECSVAEFSPVTFPAYSGATAGLAQPQAPAPRGATVHALPSRELPSRDRPWRLQRRARR